MSFTLRQVIAAARDKHAAFHKTRIGDAVAGRFLSDWQNEAIASALQREAHYLEQSIGIVISFDGNDDPGVAGAGTIGGLPAEADAAGDPAAVSESAGALVEPLDSEAEGASVFVVDRPVTSATSTTTTSTGAARAVNVDVGRSLVIVEGKGLGQERDILSNTADTWSHAAWATQPDTTSVLRVVEPILSVDNRLGVVTAAPALSKRVGYLVRLDAQGQPYIDYTKPLVATLDRGVPLPSAIAVSGGTVRYNNGEDAPLTIATYGRRFDPPCLPAIWQGGGTVYLCGTQADWFNVASLELRYSPLAPDFATRDDLFLLPDPARPFAVAALAEFFASRVAGMEGITINVGYFADKLMKAEAKYLASLRLSKRARMTIVREGYY